eukprot:COSAG06_NODE_354_length_16880_cov_7.746545_7_plen_713_part_00
MRKSTTGSTPAPLIAAVRCATAGLLRRPRPKRAHGPVPPAARPPPALHRGCERELWRFFAHLLVRRDALLVLDLRLDILDRVRSLNLEGDGLARQRLHEDLHDCVHRGEGTAAGKQSGGRGQDEPARRRRKTKGQRLDTLLEKKFSFRAAGGKALQGAIRHSKRYANFRGSLCAELQSEPEPPLLCRLPHRAPPTRTFLPPPAARRRTRAHADTRLHAPADEMPGKQPRAGEHPLSRPQSVIAAEILRRHFDPSVNTQMDANVKTTLLAMVNDAFVEKGLPPTYSLRKMEDWRANCVYRWKCRQQKKKPDCWGTDGRKRCRKARKSRETGGVEVPGVMGGAIQKTGAIHAEAFAQHCLHDGTTLLGMPSEPMMGGANTSMMSLNINNSHTESFAVPSPIMPHNTSAALAYGSSTRADEIMMIANGSMRVAPSPVSLTSETSKQSVVVGLPPSRSPAINTTNNNVAGPAAVKLEGSQQKTTWIAPSPGQANPTPVPAEKLSLPPSLASVLDSNTNALETSIPSIPVSPLAVSPPSSLGDQSIRDPADFDGMLDKSAVKTEQQAAAEDLALMSSAAKPSPLLRSSLGGLGSPSWSSFTAGGMSGMSPWAPPGGMDSAMKRPPTIQPDGAGLATMAAIEEAAATSGTSSAAATKSSAAGSMDPPPARRSSFGLTPLAVKSASQTNSNTPGYATLPKLSLSPAGSWLSSSYQSLGY